MWCSIPMFYSSSIWHLQQYRSRVFNITHPTLLLTTTVFNCFKVDIWWGSLTKESGPKILYRLQKVSFLNGSRQWKQKSERKMDFLWPCQLSSINQWSINSCFCYLLRRASVAKEITPNRQIGLHETKTQSKQWQLTKWKKTFTSYTSISRVDI